MKKYDYLIVGAGLFGCVFAREAVRAGKTCLVIDKRGHVGGNSYTEVREGLVLHTYGAHIFHTDSERVWNYVNGLVPFRNFINSPIARYRGEVYNLPFNMNTFSKLWGVVTPREAKAKLEEQIAALHLGEPKNLEEQGLKLVGKYVFEKLIKGYTGMIDQFYGYRFGELEYHPFASKRRGSTRRIFKATPSSITPSGKFPIRALSSISISKRQNVRSLISRANIPPPGGAGTSPITRSTTKKNTLLYQKYKALADGEKNVLFGGRLGLYRYFDMDKAIEAALLLAERELGKTDEWK